MPVADVRRGAVVSDTTFYVRQEKNPNRRANVLRRLTLLEDENAQLKRMVADLALDEQILQVVIQTRSEAATRLEVSAVDLNHPGF